MATGPSRDRLAAAAATPAQRALLRVLGALLGAERVDGVLRTALQSAGLNELPETFGEVQDALIPHLVHQIHDPTRPWVTTTFVEDLEAEAENERLASDPYSSARMAIATRIPERLATPVAGGADPPITARRPPSLDELRAATAASVRRIVLCWSADRFGRSGVARILVGAGFDVVGCDSVTEAREYLSSGQPIDVVLFDPDEAGSMELIEALAPLPALPILAWTRSSAEAVDATLARAGDHGRALEVLARSNVKSQSLLSALARLV